MLGPGQVFGETDILSRRGYSYSLRSKTLNSEVYLVSAQDYMKFEEQCQRDRELLKRYIRLTDIKWATKLANQVYKFNLQLQVSHVAKPFFDESKTPVEIDRLKQVLRYTSANQSHSIVSKQSIRTVLCRKFHGPNISSSVEQNSFRVTYLKKELQGNTRYAGSRKIAELNLEPSPLTDWLNIKSPRIQTAHER